MLGIRISLREIECVLPLETEGDEICLTVAGTAGEGARIVRVLPEDPVDDSNYWRTRAGRRVLPALTVFERMIPDSVVALLRFGLLVRNGGTYADAMMGAAEVTDRITQLVATNGDKTLALLQYLQTAGPELRALYRDPAKQRIPSSHEEVGIWNIQFTVSGNEWEDALFPLPAFNSTRTETGRAVTLNYEFLHDQAKYRVVLIMESYPILGG